ncbi:MAG: hypothetical protein WA814_03625 [Candidatus Baltobacteraceae bacterium]
MAAAAGIQTRFGQATLASVSIHVLAALAIPALAWTSASVAPVETVSFTRILRVETTPPRPAQSRPRAVAPHHAVKSTINFSNVHLTYASPHRHASPAPKTATNAPAGPVVGAVQRAGAGNGSGNAVPQVSPSPAVRAVASVGTHQTGGYLPFGAEQPDPVLDPGVRKQLGTLGVHVTLVVTVGDDGRTRNVVFAPPIDPQLEDHIRSLLADASWDPAVCGGGVACEGQATIRL